MSESMDQTPEPTTPDRDAYYAEARSWAQDRDVARARTLRTAWIIAGVFASIAALEALALVALAPLKTVVPYTLLVDRNTGFAQALEGTQRLPIRAESALTQSLLAQYVIARETYDINTIGEQYRKVALWSADSARADYLAQMSTGNLQSPLVRLARDNVVTARVESVSPLARDGGQNGGATGVQTALLRFTTEQRDQHRGVSTKAYWVAVLRFRYSGQPMALEDRLVNPLGFQVVSYRRDQEAPQPEDTAPAEAGAVQIKPAAPVGGAGTQPDRAAVNPANPAMAPQSGQGWGRPLPPFPNRRQPPRQPRQPAEETL